MNQRRIKIKRYFFFNVALFNFICKKKYEIKTSNFRCYVAVDTGSCRSAVALATGR